MKDEFVVFEKCSLIKLIKHNIIKYQENHPSYDTFISNLSFSLSFNVIRVKVYFGVMLIAN